MHQAAVHLRLQVGTLMDIAFRIGLHQRVSRRNVQKCERFQTIIAFRRKQIHGAMVIKHLVIAKIRQRCNCNFSINFPEYASFSWIKKELFDGTKIRL